MLPSGSAFAPVGANASAPIAATLPIDVAVLPADATATARPAMRWTTNTSGFVLRRMSQVIESGARANKGFKEKGVNQVAKS
jgi:hypothetical protein